VKDPRYRIGLEHTGAERPQYVLRFCGEWLAAYRRRRDALSAAFEHNHTRLQGR
jgi:hypothetical protein